MGAAQIQVPDDDRRPALGEDLSGERDRAVLPVAAHSVTSRPFRGRGTRVPGPVHSSDLLVPLQRRSLRPPRSLKESIMRRHLPPLVAAAALTASLRPPRPLPLSSSPPRRACGLATGSRGTNRGLDRRPRAADPGAGRPALPRLRPSRRLRRRRPPSRDASFSGGGDGGRPRGSQPLLPGQQATLDAAYDTWPRSLTARRRHAVSPSGHGQRASSSRSEQDDGLNGPALPLPDSRHRGVAAASGDHPAAAASWLGKVRPLRPALPVPVPPGRARRH